MNGLRFDKACVVRGIQARYIAKEAHDGPFI